MELAIKMQVEFEKEDNASIWTGVMALIDLQNENVLVSAR